MVTALVNLPMDVSVTLVIMEMHVKPRALFVYKMQKKIGAVDKVFVIKILAVFVIQVLKERIANP